MRSGPQTEQVLATRDPALRVRGRAACLPASCSGHARGLGPCQAVPAVRWQLVVHCEQVERALGLCAPCRSTAGAPAPSALSGWCPRRCGSSRTSPRCLPRPPTSASTRCGRRAGTWQGQAASSWSGASAGALMQRTAAWLVMCVVPPRPCPVLRDDSLPRPAGLHEPQADGAHGGLHQQCVCALALPRQARCRCLPGWLAGACAAAISAWAARAPPQPEWALGGDPTRGWHPHPSCPSAPPPPPPPNPPVPSWLAGWLLQAGPGRCWLRWTCRSCLPSGRRRCSPWGRPWAG